MKPLCIIPAYLSTQQDTDVLVACLRSLRGTAGDEVEVLVVDDGSPGEGCLKEIRSLIPQWEFSLHEKAENTGYPTSVNVGLRRCLDEGRDAITINADIQFREPGWVARMTGQRNLHADGFAWIVGGMLTYPNGLIQFAGTYFSLLTRDFHHRFQYAPENLPEAHVPTVSPITGALQFIRHECLTTIGLYDEDFRMGWEDVDFCLRALKLGKECVYQPSIRAHHLESFFRGRRSEKVFDWTRESWVTLVKKWSGQNFVGLVPPF